MTLLAKCLILLVVLCNAADKPNFLFLMCDSMDGRNMDPTAGQYPLINMPNLRNLAVKGSIFTRHYASSPQCVPGRTALFSGRRTDQQGGYNNAMGWGMNYAQNETDPHCIQDYDTKTCQRFSKMQNFNFTLLDGLRAIGYDVYLIGKVDVGAGIIEQPSQANATADGFHSGPDANGLTIYTRSANIQRATKGPPVANEHDNTVHQGDFKIAQNCMDKLHAIKKANTGRPWFLYCSINIPHPPYQTNATWLAGVDTASVELPPWVPESAFHPADAYQSISKNVWQNWTNESIMDTRNTYYAMNVETDYILGGVLNTSYSLGWNESNTVMMFTSDHGDMNMEHRQQLKNSMYEGSARIPLFFSGPGIKKGNIVRNVTATIDVLPTLLDIAGETPPGFLSGYSLTSMLYDAAEGTDNAYEDTVSVEHPDYVTSQYHSNMGNTGSYMVRQGKWKYIQFGHYLKAYESYPAQLFDLEKDTDEIYDVSADNPDVVMQMEGILANEYNYEYVDCIAKQNDFMLFEKFFWNTYNQTALYNEFEKAYSKFNETDWQTVLDWRQEMMNDTVTPCEDHAERFLRRVTDEERIQLK